MKKIFILKGVSDSGKTTKINAIANWIIQTYNVSNTIGLNPENLKTDTWGVLTIGNLRIGVNTSGDNEYEIKKVDKLLEFEVDIIICACRTKGVTYQHLYKNYISRKGWLDRYIHVEHFDIPDVEKQNLRDKRILDELKSWLTGLEKR